MTSMTNIACHNNYHYAVLCTKQANNHTHIVFRNIVKFIVFKNTYRRIQLIMVFYIFVKRSFFSLSNAARLTG